MYTKEEKGPTVIEGVNVGLWTETGVRIEDDEGVLVYSLFVVVAASFVSEPLLGGGRCHDDMTDVVTIKLE